MKYKIFLSVAMLSFNGVATAADYIGKIETMTIGPSLGNTVLIRAVGHNGSADWSVDCATNSYWSFKVDTATPGGSEAYSLLLAASVADKSIVLSGTGICTGTWGDVQDLAYTRFE